MIIFIFTRAIEEKIKGTYNVAKMRRIFFGWMATKRLSLLLRPSPLSARIKLLGMLATKAEGLLLISCCFKTSSCEIAV